MRTSSKLLSVLITGLVTLSGGAALFGGGPLIIFDPATRTPYAYGPTVGFPVPVFTDLGGFGPLTNAEADALTAFSAAEWSAVPTSSFSMAIAGDFTARSLPDIDGSNAGLVVGTFNGGGIDVMYDDDGTIITDFFGAPPGVLGIASPEFAIGGTPELAESWAVVNGDAVDPGDVGGASFAGVFTHEFGHAINLAHTQCNGAILFFGDDTGPTGCPSAGLPYSGTTTFADQETMYPFIDPSPGSIGIDMATIEHLDDTGPLSDLYPGAGWPGSFHTITGVIFLSDGVTEVTGVNVIARNVADPFGDAQSALSGDFTQGALGPDGLYTFNGLTPGADYVVYVDEIVAGGFSTPPVFPFPGPEEFYNGGSESGNNSTDDPCSFVFLSGGAGSTTTADVIFNFAIILGDDDFVEVPLPFDFQFCDGETYSSVFVGSNGFVTFGAGDFDFSESVAEFLSGPPRIAPLWDDLNPTQGGTITAEEVGGNFVITWDGVPEFFNTGSNTFSITLRPDGSFSFDYPSIDVADGLVGISPGAGIAIDPGEIDLTAASQPISGPPEEAIYELFDAFDNDLSGETLEWAGCGVTVAHEFTILAEKAIKFSKHERSEGPIHSNGKLQFKKGKPSTHEGDVTSVKDIKIEADNTINGDVTAGGKVTIHAKATVNGSVTQNASVDKVDLPTLSFTAGGTDEPVAKGGTLNLPPGSYGVVTVNKGATLVLSGGEYFMETLDMKKSTTLEVDLSGGPVTVNVTEKFVMGKSSEVVLSTGTAGSLGFTLNSLQTKGLKLGNASRFLGSLVAPNATVTLSNDVQFLGQICAKTVNVKKGVVIVPHGGSLPKTTRLLASDEKEDVSRANLPTEFKLGQNYPNPFNPSTTISYELPQASNVNLAIYNLRGQLIRTLVDRPEAPGRYEVVWDGTSDNGSRVSSGVYIYRIQAGHFVTTKKLILMK